MAARGASRIPLCANFVALASVAHYVGAPMKLLGLTGGIGMGKSTVAALLAQHGLPVVDTDVIARQVVEPGQPALDEIVTVFGREVLSADGSLRRDEVARQVFADKALRQQLEAITHPRIRAAWQAQVESWRFAGKDCAVVVIPLLFETAAESEFGAIHCVACTAATQRQRLVARGWSDEQIQRRIASQWPIDQKMALANAVIWTEGAMESTAQQVKQLLARN